MNTDKTVDEVVAATLKQLEEKRYAPGTLQHFRQRFGIFADYAKRRGIQRFTPELVEKFLAYLASPAGRRISSHRPLIGAMRLLPEVAANGSARVRKRSITRELPPRFEKDMSAVDDFTCREYGWSASTRRDQDYWTRRFLTTPPGREIPDGWDGLTAKDVFAFLQTFPHRSHRMRADVLRRLTTMFRTLFAMGLMNVPLHESLNVPVRVHSTPPPVWPEKDARRLLDVVDVSVAPGRRDLAILSLAYFLGMRTSDIRALRLDALHWEEGKIDFIQCKTGRPISLPLLPEVGNALLGYLRHERPVSDAPEVFLRHLAPRTPFPPGCNFSDLIHRYSKKAGLVRVFGCGMHALRRTVATRLLGERTPFTVIAACLGHTDMDTTRIYIRTNMDLLREVALDPETEVTHA